MTFFSFLFEYNNDNNTKGIMIIMVKQAKYEIYSERSKIFGVIHKAIRCFVFGLIFARVNFGGESVFWGTAYTAACGADGYGVVALIGVFLAGKLLMKESYIDNDVVAALLVYTINFVCRHTVLYQKRWFMPSVVAVVVGITMLFSAVSMVDIYPQVISTILFRCSLSFFITDVFSEIREWLNDKKNISNLELKITIATSVIVFSFMRFKLFSVLSLGRMIAFVFQLLSVNVLLSPNAVITSTVLGLSVDLFCGTVQYAPISFLWATLCLLFQVKRRLFHGFIFAVIYFFVNENYVTLNEVFVEMIFSLTLYFILPNHILIMIRKNVSVQAKKAQVYVSSNEYHVTKSREFLFDLQHCLHMEREKIFNLSGETVVECAFSDVCSKCYKRDLCMSNHKLEMADLFFQIKSDVENNGLIDVECFPKNFSEYCPYKKDLVERINYISRRKFEENKSEIANYEQRNHFCNILSEVSECLAQVEEGVFKDSKRCSEISDILFRFFIEKNIACDFNVYETRNGFVSIEVFGSDAKKLFQNMPLLDELSGILNIRLRILKNSNEADIYLLMEAEPFAVSVGVAVKKKKGEKVCGDRTSYFKTDEGMFYAILSDGMGSGDNAEKQSAMLIEMLEHFIIQGIPTIRAIHLIHSIISLNNLDLMDSATLDLLEINLYSGETSMYKIGAAPSYLYSFDKIKMIHESNLSVGAVPGVEFHVDRKSESLSAGDVIVMTSDGVDIYDIQKLDYMISRENSMKLLARNILSESLSFNENNDDMTVLVVRMELRG